MKQTLPFLAVLAILASCTGPTQITNSWKEPSTVKGEPSAKKIVVAALIHDQGVRRQVEDYMVSLFPGSATQSYRVLGEDSLLAGEEKIYSSRLKEQGYDGVMIMQQVAENSKEVYITGQPATSYTTWTSNWRRGWGSGFATTRYNPGTPGHYATNRTWSVQVNVYSLITNKLIWAANTSTTNPGGRVPLFDDVCKAVRSQMKKDGFTI